MPLEMDNFIAIDVETANKELTSICSIGAVKVIDGTIVDRFYELIRPTPNYYLTRFSEEIHGISRSLTDSAPKFPEIWPKLKAFIGGLPLVAHNQQFDKGCLRATAKAYGLEWPDYKFYCTLNAARRTIPRAMCSSYSLPCLADFLGIPFNNHHNAIADAEAAAKIAMTLL